MTDAPAHTPGRHPVKPSPMRAAIARRMVQSKQQAPHFYVSTEIEMDVLLDLADARNEGRPKEERVTLTAYLLRALAMTLREHPAFNAVWEGDTVVRVDAINIGVAIAVPDGLIAPALLDCGGTSVAELAASLGDLVTRTRAGKLRAPEINDGTFTLSNLGMFDVSSFTAIVTPPQVAILATARTEPRAVVREGQVVVRRILSCTLSSDHRVVDGAGAAAFLATFKQLTQAPAGWVDDAAEVGDAPTEHAAGRAIEAAAVDPGASGG